MRQLAFMLFVAWGLAACGGSDGGDGTSGDPGPTGPDPNANTDGDCMKDVEELELGTDPNKADSDGDGIGDCDEITCVSDPIDGAEKCYACGWKHNDPGTIVPTGTTVGSVMANIDLVDQCGELVSLYDFAGSYHILYMTAAW